MSDHEEHHIHDHSEEDHDHDHEHGEQEEDEQYLDPNDDIEVVSDAEDDNEPMDEEEEGENGEINANLPLEDNSNAHSIHHEASIFSVSLHPQFPNPPLAISGGEDDLGFIFSPLTPSTSSAIDNSTFEPIRLTGHTDSVVASGFSADGEFVATGGMDGKVRVWRRTKDASADASSVEAWKNWEFLTSLDTGDEVTWLAWHPKGPVLAAGCNDSTVWMWQLPSGNTMQVFSSHTETSTSGYFSPNGKLLITISADSSLCVYDPRENAPLLRLAPHQTPNFGKFEDGLTALAVSPASNLIAIGGADGGIRIINLPAGNVVGRFPGHAQGESVEGLAFMDILGLAGPGGDGSTKGLLLVSAGTDGKAIIWDVTTGKPRAEVHHEDVVTSVVAHPAPRRWLFTTASADKTLRTWDARQGALIATHKGHAGTINAVAVASAPAGWALEDGQEDSKAEVVVSAGDDGAVLVWRV